MWNDLPLETGDELRFFNLSVVLRTADFNIMFLLLCIFFLRVHAPPINQLIVVLGWRIF